MKKKRKAAREKVGTRRIIIEKASSKRCHITAKQIDDRNQLYEESIAGRQNSKYKGYEPFGMFEKVQETDIVRNVAAER